MDIEQPRSEFDEPWCLGKDFRRWLSL